MRQDASVELTVHADSIQHQIHSSGTLKKFEREVRPESKHPIRFRITSKETRHSKFTSSWNGARTHASKDRTRAGSSVHKYKSQEPTARMYRHPMDTKTDPKASPKKRPETHNSSVMAKPNAPSSTARRDIECQWVLSAFACVWPWA